jgi:hypothetical protein
MSIALSSPKLRVVFGNPEHDAETWEAVEVQTIGRDMSDAEELLARNGLGKLTDLPINGAVATAYYALKRTGKRAGDWAAFQDEYIEVTPVDGQVIADPTRTAPESGPLPR